MALPHLRAIRFVVLVGFVEGVWTATALEVPLVAGVREDSPTSLASLASTDGRTTNDRSLTQTGAVARIVDGCHPVIHLLQVDTTQHSGAGGEADREVITA